MSLNHIAVGGKEDVDIGLKSLTVAEYIDCSGPCFLRAATECTRATAGGPSLLVQKTAGSTDSASVLVVNALSGSNTGDVLELTDGITRKGGFDKDWNLDTTGLIKAGSFATGSLPAAASYEGYIAYDSTTKTMKWSNGTVWATI